jgi:hypothetical protein
MPLAMIILCQINLFNGIAYDGKWDTLMGLCDKYNENSYYSCSILQKYN